MSSQIRELLSAAQQAEVKGERSEAVRLLNEAASFYRERNMASRAEQMVRHARRLEGDETVEPPARRPTRGEGFDEDDFDGPTGTLDWSDGAPETDGEFGFGDELLGAASQAAKIEFERIPVLAEASADAWCSFCCRSQRDVGPVVAGPAGAYVCAGCVSVAGELLGRTVSPSSSNGP
ncbi:MAG: ClpX C4-type zinc finger protein, partial [Archangium sp.]|nr:ClpX C4-type zinc finger protein [Archangium sp.]